LTYVVPCTKSCPPVSDPVEVVGRLRRQASLSHSGGEACGPLLMTSPTTTLRPAVADPMTLVACGLVEVIGPTGPVVSPDWARVVAWSRAAKTSACAPVGLLFWSRGPV
jgi:hypothetical protein